MNPSLMMVPVTILLFPLTLCWAQSTTSTTWNPDAYVAPAPQGTLKRKLKKKKVSEEPRNASILIPAFVVHGTQPNQLASNSMPGKIDNNGNMVMTPGVGLEYRGEGGLLIISAVVKDCYNDLAGTFQIGKYWELGKRTQWGLTMGVYARQTPLSCTYDYWGNKNCINLDNYPYKFSATINNQPVDIIPMPFLTFSTALYKDNQFEVDFKVMGNVVLNEVGFAVPF